MTFSRVSLSLIVSTCAAMAADPPSTPVTFNKDVLPILQKNCQTCHRPGQAGPMSFLTYQSTRPWAKAMKEAVVLRKMPPWFADPKVGHFINDPSLKQNEIDTIAKWADAGAPEGNPKDAPAPVQWAEGWHIQPDVVITDIIMPDQEGIETIRNIRRLRPDARIIAMSGGGRIGNIDFLSAAALFGAREILAKPFEPRELIERVSRCLGIA